MFHSSIIALAERVNHTLIARKQMIVTAESCTASAWKLSVRGSMVPGVDTSSRILARCCEPSSNNPSADASPCACVPATAARCA